MYNMYPAMCHLIWLLMLNCPGLSPWSSPLLCLYSSWWYHMSAICHQLSTSPDLTSLPNSKLICPLSPLECLIDITNLTCSRLTLDLCKNCPTFFFPLLMATATFQFLRPKSLEPSKCYSLSYIPHPVHYKGHPVVSVFKVHPKFSHFPSLSFYCFSPNHNRHFLH